MQKMTTAHAQWLTSLDVARNALSLPLKYKNNHSCFEEGESSEEGQGWSYLFIFLAQLIKDFIVFLLPIVDTHLVSCTQQQQQTQIYVLTLTYC